MKYFNRLLVLFLVVASCNPKAQNETNFDSFGKEFNQKSVADAASLYGKLQVADTALTQINGTIKEVCQSKGCWMKVDLAHGEEVFVKFKDYGFFVPKDASNKKVVMNGLAFIEQMSVDEQRHYAEDEGLSKEAVEKITEPKKTLRFEADGVKIQKAD